MSDPTQQALNLRVLQQIFTPEEWVALSSHPEFLTALAQTDGDPDQALQKALGLGIQLAREKKARL